MWIQSSLWISKTTQSKMGPGGERPKTCDGGAAHGERRAPAAKPRCKFHATLFDKQQHRFVYMQRPGETLSTQPCCRSGVMLERWHPMDDPCLQWGHLARLHHSNWTDARTHTHTHTQANIFTSSQGSNVAERSDGLKLGVRSWIIGFRDPHWGERYLVSTLNSLSSRCVFGHR